MNEDSDRPATLEAATEINGAAEAAPARKPRAPRKAAAASEAPRKPRAPRKPKAAAQDADLLNLSPADATASPADNAAHAEAAPAEAPVAETAAPAKAKAKPKPRAKSPRAPKKQEAAAEPEASLLPEAEAAPLEAPVVAAQAPAEQPSVEVEVPYLQAVEAVAEAEPEAPRTTFEDLGLSEALLQGVAETGYVHPTPIQEQAIPVVLMGRDVLGCAQTGTGKTASFVLPMMEILADSRAKARMPRSLILEPTRELALQVAENFEKYGKHMKLVHALLIGGESMADQRAVLEKGVDVLIATPGRLLDLFDRGRILLADCKILVIDEADRMLDMGFIPDVERIVSMLPPLRQTLFFSATMAPDIRKLADAFLQNPKEITVSAPASVANTITTGLLWVQEQDKREALRRLLRTNDVQNALIFCNRKRDVDILYRSLQRHGFSVGALHGDMDQSSRFATLTKFKAGELQLLVCSDVAARGIDIGGLSHVFNFDVPFHSEDYVHRIGRTGRAGREGHAYTIATADDAKLVSAIEKLTGREIPPITVEGLAPVTAEERAEAEARPRGGRGRGGNNRGAKPGRGGRDTAPREQNKHARGQEGRGENRGEPHQEARADARPQDARAQDARPQEARGGRDDRGNRGRDDRNRDGARGPREDRQRDERGRDERGRHDQPRNEAPRNEAAREDRFREDRNRDERRRNERPRDQQARDQQPRDNYRENNRRDRDDLGPTVRGFGDAVPAFMLIPLPRPRRSQNTESENGAEAA